MTTDKPVPIWQRVLSVADAATPTAADYAAASAICALPKSTYSLEQIAQLIADCRIALANSEACRAQAEQDALGAREFRDQRNAATDALNYIRSWLTSPDLSPMTLQHIREVVRIGLGLPAAHAQAVTK